MSARNVRRKLSQNFMHSVPVVSYWMFFIRVFTDKIENVCFSNSRRKTRGKLTKKANSLANVPVLK